MFGLTLLAMMLVSCAGSTRTPIEGTRRLVEESEDDRPDWATREPSSDDEFHYFRGIRSGALTLEAGETDAKHNALARIVEFLGLRVRVDYQRLRTEELTKIEDVIHSIGGADIFGTRLSELYFQRFEVYSGGRVHQEHDVYVLIRFPKAAIDQFYESQQAKVRQLFGLLGAPIIIDVDRVYPSLLKTAQVLESLSQWENSLTITSRVENEVEGLKRKSIQQLSRLISPVRISVSTERDPIFPGPQTPPLAIKATVTQESRGALSPMPNVPVSFQLGEDASALKIVVTSDANGVATWEIIHIPYRDEVELTATIQLPDAIAGSGFGGAVPTATILAPIKDVVESTTVLVVVEERRDGVDSGNHLVEGRLVAALADAGFRVVSSSELPTDQPLGDPWRNAGQARALAQAVKADIVVTGQASTGPVERSKMLQDTFFWCRASMHLQAIRTSDGVVVAAIDLPNDQVRDTRGYGPSAEQAADQAFALTRNRGSQPSGYPYVAKLIESSVRGL